jgi:hypothetical protein
MSFLFELVALAPPLIRPLRDTLKKTRNRPVVIRRHSITRMHLK